MSAFLDDFTVEELDYCINNAYDMIVSAIAPLVRVDGQYNLELFHSSTIAFKDMALSILPYFMTTAARNMVWRTRLLSWQRHLLTRESCYGGVCRCAWNYWDYRLLSKGWCQQDSKVTNDHSDCENNTVLLLLMVTDVANKCEACLTTGSSIEKLTTNKLQFSSANLYEHWSSGATNCLLCFMLTAQLVKTGEIVAGEKG